MDINSCTFSSDTEFLNYFRKHDILEVQDTFIIEDITNITEGMDITDLESLKKDAALYLLNKIVLPTMQKISVENNDKLIFDLENLKKFSFKSKGNFTLRAERSNIHTLLPDLFHRMIQSSIYCFTLEANQKLSFCDVDEKFNLVNDLNIKKKFLELMVDSNLATLSINGSISQLVGGEWNMSMGWTNYGRKKRTFCAISGNKVCTFDFNIIFENRYSFLNTMLNKREIKVLKNQKLRIKYERVLDLWQIYNSDLKKYFKFIDFIFNQMLLTQGKTVNFKETKKNQIIECTVAEDILEIWSSEEFVMKLQEGDIQTTAELLNKALLSIPSHTIKIKAHQKIQFYNINIKDFENWINTSDDNEVKKGFREFFQKISPLGFDIRLSYNKELKYEVITQLDEEEKALFSFFQISSTEDMNISLRRSSGTYLAFQLCQHSALLRNGLEDEDPEAFIFILFKALFHCCEAIFHGWTKEIPDYFQESTKYELIKLVHKDQFILAMKTIFLSKDLLETFVNYLHYSPEDFSNINFKELPQHIGTVFKEIQRITFQELRGSPFLQKDLLFLKKYNESKNSEKTE